MKLGRRIRLGAAGIGHESKWHILRQRGHEDI